MNAKERLRKYVNSDEIYKLYKQRKLNNPSDFDLFCVQHCSDIETILNKFELTSIQKNNLKAFKKYYINATKEEIIEDMYLEICNLQQKIDEANKMINGFFTTNEIPSCNFGDLILLQEILGVEDNE